MCPRPPASQDTITCGACSPTEAGAPGAASVLETSKAAQPPPAAFDYARDVMLTQTALAAVALNSVTDEEAFEAWPVITVGSRADLDNGSVPPGLFACDITRRTPLGNPFRMGPKGDAYHLAPSAVYAFSQLLLDPTIDIDAAALNHPGLVPCSSRSQCRCTLSRDQAIEEMASRVAEGTKLFFECCGLKDCHGIPLGLHVLDMVSAKWLLSGTSSNDWKAVRHGIGVFRPAGPASGPRLPPSCDSSNELGTAAVQPADSGCGPWRAIKGFHPGSITVQCPHGFVTVQGEDDATLRPFCTLIECIQGAFAYVRKPLEPAPAPPVPSAHDVADAAALLDELSPPAPDAWFSSASPSGFRHAALESPHLGSLAALNQRCPPTGIAARKRAVRLQPPAWDENTPSFWG